MQATPRLRLGPLPHHALPERPSLLLLPRHHLGSPTRNWTPCDTLRSGSSTTIGATTACRPSFSVSTPPPSSMPRTCSNTTTSGTGGRTVASRTWSTPRPAGRATPARTQQPLVGRTANGMPQGVVRCLCVVKSLPPAAAITDHQWSMMYDDAHANWGHRDNILHKSHRAVNIGVASNGRRVTFVQHFEGGAVEADGPPVLDAHRVLSLSLTKRETGVAIGGVVSIAHDPPPTPKTPVQIDTLDSYCLGGGFTTYCPDSHAARILEPPGAGYHYSNLDANEVVASSWTETADGFSFTADVWHLLAGPGVYTIVVWRDSGVWQLSEVLVELSLFVE